MRFLPAIGVLPGRADHRGHGAEPPQCCASPAVKGPSKHVFFLTIDKAKFASKYVRATRSSMA